MIKTCNVCGEQKEHKSYKAYTCIDCTEKGLKWCPGCSSIQPITNFHKNGKALRSLCKPCEINRCRVSKGATLTVVNSYSNTEERRKARNLQSSICRRKKYASSGTYRIKEINRSHNRRIKKDAQGSVSMVEWLNIVEKFNNTCAYCGTKHNLTQDHIIALSKEGTNTYANIVPACGSCNSSKGNKEVVEWYTSRNYYNEEKLTKVLNHLKGRCNI